MSREYFIIMVYVLVCENYQAVVGQQPLRRRGFPPALTDEEVITIEICGEYVTVQMWSEGCQLEKRVMV
jgi:hypothetical protein